MALANIAQMSVAVAPGTGTSISLDTAVPGYVDFATAGISDGQVVSYSIEDGVNREVGRAQYVAASTELINRTPILSTAGAATPINATINAKVFVSVLKEDFDDLLADIASRQPLSQKGQANGYASLDGNGKVPVAQIPIIAATGVSFTPAGGVLAGNVQAAIQELDTKKVAKSGDTITGSLQVNESIRIGAPGWVSTGTPFIDFFSAAGATNYGARIIVTGGTTTQGSAVLDILAAEVRQNGQKILTEADLTWADAYTKAEADTKFFPKTGGALTGNLAVGGELTYGKAKIINNTDLDALTVPGFYDGNNLVNAPNGSSDWFYVEVQRHSQNNNYVYQRATALNHSGFTTWVRNRSAGVWQPWRQVWDSGNLGTATESSAGIVELATTAEVQAGIDNTRAVTPAGLAAAGATRLQTARTLTIGNTGKAFDGSADVSWSLAEIGAARFGTLANSTDLNTVVSTGFYRLNSPLGNAPAGVDYGQLIVARGGGDTILQIVTGFVNGEIYWRQGNPPDVGGSGSWGPWHRFYHSGHKATADQFRSGTANTILTSDNVWAAAGYVGLSGASGSTLAAGTYTPNFNAGINFFNVLGGNITIGNPTNAKPGQTGLIVLQQDGTGGRTVAFGSVWKFANNTVPPMNTSNSRVNVIAYQVLHSGFVIGSIIAGLVP